MAHTLYLLCTTSRTGSTHLCRLLAAAGKLGSPDEYFNEPLITQQMKALQLTKEHDYVTHILNTTSTPNRVCGIKLATDAFARLRKACGEKRFAELAPQYIWLRRRDVLRQAISLYRAEASGIWHWPAGEPCPTAEVAFDAPRIRECQAQIRAANEAWSRWFRELNARPLELWYEDVCRDAASATCAVAQAAGVQLPSGPTPQPHLVILRDELTETWRARLLAGENLSDETCAARASSEACPWHPTGRTRRA